MGRYTGTRCIMCEQSFKEDDEIVVCPDCGTPYHRSCWNEQKCCINTSLHAVGGSWQTQQSELRRKQGGRPCPKCSFVNKPYAEFCGSCGVRLMPPAEQEQEHPSVRVPLPGGKNAYFDAADPCCGASPEEPIEEERLGDVASFVDRNTLYYIPLFRQFRDTGKKISLNLSCLLFPNLYFAYRKMWLMAILCTVILVICDLPVSMMRMLETLTSKEYTNMLSDLYGADAIHMFDGLVTFLRSWEDILQSLDVPMFLFGLGIRGALCLMGNYMYFRHVMAGVGKIRRLAPTKNVRTSLLRSEGGASIWNVVGCAAMWYFANVGIYVALALFFMQ